MRKLQFTYENPLVAVFLRILSWEAYIAKASLKVGDLEKDQLQAARNELGLTPYLGGAGHDFIQKLRKHPKPLLTEKHSPPMPLESGWDEAWRMLYLPSHASVRLLSKKPVVSEVPVMSGSHFEFKISPRNAALPELRVFVGKERPDNQTFKTLRGLYFLRLNDSLYLGKSDEFSTRFRGHKGTKQPKWWAFVTTADTDHVFTLDTLGAAEALLISFWNEVAVVKNRTRGGDQKPAQIWLQQGVLFAEAASAAFLWLVREKQDAAEKLGLSDWTIPLKKWPMKGWPNSYLG